MIAWENLTGDEVELIDKIAGRTVQMFPKADKQTVLMDVSATHLSCPLRLQDLLDADEFNFAHDIFGIRDNLDRKTGELKNYFSPRFTCRTQKLTRV